MKKQSKLIAIGIFALFALILLINNGFSKNGWIVSAQTGVQPTPTPVAEKPAGEAPKAADKTIPKDFILSQDSLSEYGPAPFDHETHAFQKYSPDGKSVIGCIECHHTDQPKSELKPPLITSERDVVLTMESWQKSTQEVSKCRACHFQEGNVPDGKVMPTATYKDADKEVTKVLNNELAYHINCNTCHDAAAQLRPELKGKKGFSTSKDCMICHEEQ